MMTRAFFYLIIGLFDHITCTYYDPNACHPNDVYPNPGFTPSCQYQCISGGVVLLRPYADGTYCFVKYSGGDEAVSYLGYCERGVCLPANIEPSGKLPHQWDGTYHVCDDKKSVYQPVRNCTYICEKQKKPYLPRQYYYGIYTDTKCMLQDGKVGHCRSGFCYGMEYFQSTVKPQKPVVSQKPATPQKPSIPQGTVKPQRPVIPQSPIVPQRPQMPQVPQIPQIPQMPNLPQIPVKPQRTVKSTPSKNVP
uniref:Basic tail protein n=2 Tax=Ixodes ricinus TaxID=34613 RepID=V5GGC4_IXORI